MPFLKNRHKIHPLWKQWEKDTYKTGLRHAVFNVSGDKYIGDWKTNKHDGKGALLTRSGKLYEGDWERNYRHGYGILSEKQSNDVYRTLYIGEWWNGKKQGIGRHIFPDGSWYEGEWKNGKQHGYGLCMFAEGSFYYGQWKNDKFHGYGLYIQANGNQYEGEWQLGNKHGRGKFYHLNSGQLQEGIWDQDICLCSNMTDIYFRQTAHEPTRYPIPQIKLQNVTGVYQETEEEVLRMQTDPNYSKPEVKSKCKHKLHKQPKIDWDM